MEFGISLPFLLKLLVEISPRYYLTFTFPPTLNMENVTVRLDSYLITMF